MFARDVTGSSADTNSGLLNDPTRRYSVSSFKSYPLDSRQSLPIIPPPKRFANDSSESSPKAGPLKRNARPPLPTKPQFMANGNMNNNNQVRTQMAPVSGPTKLKNLMLIREPPARKPARRLSSTEDDSYDSLSDTDDSSDENDTTLKKDDTISIGGASTISTVSTASFECLKEENRGLFVIVKISIPEQKLTKCMQLKLTETVWIAKQRIIHSLAKKFADPLNYGLYHEKLGTFLLDHKPVSDYIESGTVGSLQMRYKCKKMTDHPRNSKEGRHLAKMQSASKRRDLLNHVQQFATDKIYTLLRKGIDPNFQCPNTGETPLTILSSGQSRPECVPVFMALMGGGAHLDFRNQRGFTPMHVAARSGNIQMLKTLVEFQASPNVVDGRDLTPLYHCVLLGSDPEGARILIENHSVIGCCDSQGWSEIHQACRHGRIQLLELLLSYQEVDDDMINARNASGNTPLHVCALYNQDACAVTLLRHGADASVRNFANQDAVQVAHVAANVNVAQLITEYPDRKDDYPPLAIMRAESMTNVLASTPQGAVQEHEKKQNVRATWTPQSLLKHSKQYMLQKQLSVGGTLGRNKDTYPVAPVENRFDSRLPPNATIPDSKYQKTKYPGSPNSASISNGVSDPNKVRIVVRNYDAQTPDELTLRVGTRVVILNTRSTPSGYHDGVAGNQRGFFPKECVEEVTLRRPLPDTGQRSASDNVINDKRNSVKGKSTKKPHTSADSVYGQNRMPDSISLVSFESNDDTSPDYLGRARNDDMAGLQATSLPGTYHSVRSVRLWKGEDGFGFILRGAKSEGPVHEFTPTPKYPALQYLESIEDGSNAHNVGLRSGDFIIRIGETDVRRYGHQQLVETIRACGEPLFMQVITVVHRKPSGETASVHSGSSGKHTTKTHGKSDSVASALDQLDNVIAMEDDGDHTATLRRLPGSRKLRTEDLQDLFARQNGEAATQVQRNSAQQSTFSSARRPIRVLPPSLSSVSYQNQDIEQHSPSHVDDSASVRSLSSSSSNSSTFTTWGRYSGSANAPLVENQPLKSQTVSQATGSRMMSQGSMKSRTRMPPPPPKRINSRLSVTSDDSTGSAVQPPMVPVVPVPSSPASASIGTQHTTSSGNQQSSMAAAIALAAKNRAARASLSEEQAKKDHVQEASIPKNNQSQEQPVEEPAPKSVREISSALSLALAAKQRILDQRGTDVKKTQPASFTIDPSRSSVKKISNPLQFGSSVPTTRSSSSADHDRHVLPPPPLANFPPPPPPGGDAVDVTGLALPPPPSFPAPNPHSDHHTRYNHLTFDEILSLPPPPSDMLPTPNSHAPTPSSIKPPEEYRRSGAKSKPATLGFLPPPPLPPPMDDDEEGGCTSPTGADNLSNADSGVADVTGDGLNNSHPHRSALSDPHHDHVIGDNHSTVSSVSTLSTLSSEDGNSDYVPERAWPLREVKHISHEDPKHSPPSSPAGNMYLDVLKKAKNKQAAPATTSASGASDAKKNLRPGITVTKMTFAPIATLPPPAEEPAAPRPKSNEFPPAPKEFSSASPKAATVTAKPPAPIVQTKKVEFTPKPIATPVAIIKEKTSPIATKAPEFGRSANNNPSPQKTASALAPAAAAPSNKKPIGEWSVKDVTDWLRELQLEMYIPTFEENEISGEHLPELGKDELIELGVKRVGHRMTIDRSVKKLLNP